MERHSKGLTNADPIVESPVPEPVTANLEDHVGTYNRFLHLVKWFCIHMALLLVALYFFIISGESATGILFLALAVGALVYGIISLSGARATAAAAMNLPAHAPDE